MKPRHNPLLQISAALALGIVGSAQASSYTWNSNGGDPYIGTWTDTSADGWNGGTPVSGDTALIDNGTVSATANNQQAGVQLSIGSAGVLNDGGTFFYFSGGSLTLNSGTINVSFQGDSTYRSGGLGATVTANSGTSSINNNGANQGLALENGGTTFGGAGNLNLGLGLFDNWADGTGDGIIKNGAGTLTMTANSNYSGATTVSGGVLDLSTGVIYANAGWASRTININNGGTVKLSNWGDGNVTTAGGFGQIDFAAGNIVLDNGTLEYVGGAASGNMDRSFTIGAGGGTLIANGSATWEIAYVNRGWGDYALASHDGNLTLSGPGNGSISKVIPGNGGVSKTGNGTWTLSAANTYNGNTTVSTGTLALSGGGSIANSATVAVASGANLDVSAVTGGNWTLAAGKKLTGSGLVTGVTTIAGTHAPGSSPGVQSFSGDLTYASTAIFEWDLESSASGTRGTQYDGVNVGGTLSGATGAVFKVVLNSGAFTDTFWNTNQTWSDIFKANVDGTGSAMDIASVFSAIQWYEGTTDMTSLTGAQGLFTLSGTTLTWTAVPEPTSALAGLLLTAGLLRRRRYECQTVRSSN